MMLDMFRKWDNSEQVPEIPYWAQKFYKLSGILYKDAQFYMDTMFKYAKILENPHNKWVSLYEKEPDIKGFPQHYILSSLLMPALTSIWTKEIDMMCRLQNYQAALAINRFHNKYKCLPEKLEQVVPEFLEKIPFDFYSSESSPIKYLKTENGYIVYSLGYNQIDEQGNSERKIGEDHYPDIGLNVEFQK